MIKRPTLLFQIESFPRKRGSRNAGVWMAGRFLVYRGTGCPNETGGAFRSIKKGKKKPETGRTTKPSLKYQMIKRGSQAAPPVADTYRSARGSGRAINLPRRGCVFLGGM